MMKQICISIEKMKHLEELGLDTSDASMFYQLYRTSDGEEGYHLCALAPFSEAIGKVGDKTVIFPAYTLQDILNILPSTIQFGDAEYTFRMGKYHIFYEDVDDINPILCCVTDPSDDILIVGYKALLWCIENNYIKANKI